MDNRLNDIVDKLDSSLNELKERKEWTRKSLGRAVV